MSELEQANETSMGLPRSGSGRSTNTTIINNNHVYSKDICHNNNTTTNNNNNNIESNSVRRGEKRPWMDEPSIEEPPTKLVCTSPPHALCAEDIAQQPHQPPHSQVEANIPPTDVASPTEEHLLPIDSSSAVSDESDEDFLDDEEDKDSGFIDSNSIDNSSDDDMDVRLSMVTSTSNHLQISSTISDSSSFQQSVIVTSSLDKLSISNSIESVIYSNTIDSTSNNSSSGNCLETFEPSVVPTSNQLTDISPLPNIDVAFIPTSFPQFTSTLDAIGLPEQSPLQSQTTLFNDSNVSISEALSTSIALSIDVLSNNNNPLSFMNPCSINSDGTSTSCGLPSITTAVGPSCSTTVLPSISTVTRSLDYSVGSETNISSAGVSSNTIVTTSYPGTVSTAAYDPNILYSSYGSEFQPRQPNANLTNNSWSCNFYDGNQPTMTNKYMEIQTSKMSGTASTSQAIQCDANGKSYMDLGSTSPYTQTYSNDCANYTTSPSNTNYSNSNYNHSSFTNPSYNQQQQQPPPSQSNQFYRPNYNQYNNYPTGENYPSNYEGESSGCSYGYPSYNSTRSSKILPARCGSPFCDPTKSSSRSPCYQQQRMSVLNVSMCTLNRVSKYPDPSLHKSVLICNTLRSIEKELESEGTTMNALLNQQHMMQSLPPHPPPTPPPHVMGSSECPLPPMPLPMMSTPPLPCTPPPALSPYSSPVQYRGVQYSEGTNYEELRVYPNVMETEPVVVVSESSTLSVRHQSLPTTPAGQGNNASSATSFNSNNTLSATVSTNTSSSSSSNVISCISSVSSSNTTGDERPESGINWCSVLSLSAQSGSDSLNNNEYDWVSETSMEVEYSNNSSSNSSSPGNNNRSNINTVPNKINGRDESTNLLLPSLSADDVLKSIPEASNKKIESSEKCDSLISVSVES